jgi:hypothetical protein
VQSDGSAGSVEHQRSGVPRDSEAADADEVLHGDRDGAVRSLVVEIGEQMELRDVSCRLSGDGADLDDRKAEGQLIANAAGRLPRIAIVALRKPGLSGSKTAASMLADASSSFGLRSPTRSSAPMRARSITPRI